FSSRRRHTRFSRDWKFRRVLFRSGDDQHDVEADRPVLDVVEVEPLVGVEGRVVAGLDLPQPGDPGADLRALAQARAEHLDLLGEIGRASCREGVDVWVGAWWVSER